MFFVSFFCVCTYTHIYVINGKLTGQRHSNKFVQPLVIPLLRKDGARVHHANEVTDFRQVKDFYICFILYRGVSKGNSAYGKC